MTEKTVFGYPVAGANAFMRGNVAYRLIRRLPNGTVTLANLITGSTVTVSAQDFADQYEAVQLTGIPEGVTILPPEEGTDPLPPEDGDDGSDHGDDKGDEDDEQDVVIPEDADPILTGSLMDEEDMDDDEDESEEDESEDEMTLEELEKLTQPE